MLTEPTGLRDRVHFHMGDATSIAFPNQSFGLAWSQHSTMSIQVVFERP